MDDSFSVRQIGICRSVKLKVLSALITLLIYLITH